MAHLLNQRESMRLLGRHGWSVARGGKHAVKMVKPGERPIPLPHHGGGRYGKGLTQAILKQAGLEKEGRAWSSLSSYIRSERASGAKSRSYRDASPRAER